MTGIAGDVPGGTVTSSLAGRRALVTGGGRGLGAAIVRRFRSEGMTVWPVDVRDSDDTTIRVADVTDSAAIDAVVGHFVEEEGPMDVCVANAGVLELADVVDTDDGMWGRMLGVNLTGAFFTVRAAARQMIRQGTGGSIIVTISIAGLRGEGGVGAYTASKFGVVGLVQCLAQELGGHGVRVNGVCPGDMVTPMHERVVGGFSEFSGVPVETIERALAARIPLGRIASTEDIVGAFRFLASDDARYITGSALVVDGGQLLSWAPLA